MWNLVFAAAGSGVIFLFVSVHYRSDTANLTKGDSLVGNEYFMFPVCMLHIGFLGPVSFFPRTRAYMPHFFTKSTGRGLKDDILGVEEVSRTLRRLGANLPSSTCGKVEDTFNSARSDSRCPRKRTIRLGRLINQVSSESGWLRLSRRNVEIDPTGPGG